MRIAGLDIGTTGCKCTVFDSDGTYLNKAYRTYPVKRSISGHEIDVTTVMDAVYETIQEMAALYPDIAGIGVTSFGETFVCTDAAGKPLYPSMLYTDPRGSLECAELTDRLGEREIAYITGLRPHEMYSISKMMWLRKHEPEIWAQTKHIFLMEDYVVYHLTGKRQIDYSLASRTMAFDIQKLTWSEEIFKAADIDPAIMSAPVPTGTAAGSVTEEAAQKTGLRPVTRIISIGHDQIAAAVGAGVFDGDTAVDGAGTVECLTPIYDSMPEMDAMYEGYFSVVPYVLPGKYAAYAFSYTGGALIQWCCENLAKEESRTAKESGVSVYSLLEKKYREKHREDESSGLLVLPHFAGAATPYMDTGSKGAVLGLTIDTSVEEIYRGCMEGVVYEMYLNVRKLQNSGVHYNRIHATGGGARSAVWMQMKADMLGIPMTALKTEDAGTVGCAMLTGIAVGVFSDVYDAGTHMVEPVNTYYPRQDMHDKYMRVFERYEKVYGAVRPLMHAVQHQVLGEITG